LFQGTKGKRNFEYSFLLKIEEKESREIMLGWLDCRRIAITQSQDIAELSEAEKQCLDLNTDS
jgi:hypothetical protein